MPVTIIKEHTTTYAVLRTNTYAHDLAHFNRLFQEAQRDFPGLQAEDVFVVQYGGTTYRHTFGIEFVIPQGAKVPDTYTPIDQLESDR